MSPSESQGGVLNENGRLSAPVLRELLKQRRENLASGAEPSRPSANPADGDAESSASSDQSDPAGTSDHA